MRFSGACATLALATAAHATMLPAADGAAAAGPAAPPATTAAPATFEQRIDRMLSAALLADLFPFTRDPDISDEGYEAGMALALQCARLAPERRAGWDLVILLADQVEGGVVQRQQHGAAPPAGDSVAHLLHHAARKQGIHDDGDGGARELKSPGEVGT